MKLTIADRLNIIYGGLLPTEGSIESMSYSKSVKDKLIFTPEEIDEIGLETTESGYMKWKDDKDSVEYEIDLKAGELTMLDKQIKKLDTEEKITIHVVDICKKIQELV